MVHVNRSAGVWFIAAYIVLALACFIGLYFGFRNDSKIEAARQERIGQINRLNIAQCQALHLLYQNIRRTVIQSDLQVDNLAYYKEHPEEAEAVHTLNAATLERFRHRPCPKDVTVEP